MAGFAVVMTILTYGFFGVVSTCIASAIFYWLARRRLKSGAAGSPRFPVFAAAAPFLGLGWLCVALLLHVLISNGLAHQDCGLSGDPYVTLPNGYTVGSLNTYSGYIKAPGAQTGAPITGPGYVRSVISVAYADGVFRGTLYDFQPSGLRTFVFDTRDRSIKLDDPPNPYTWDAAQARAHTDPQSYWVLYQQYRHRWPSYLLLALILMGEPLIGLWLYQSATANGPSQKQIPNS